jgi:hypothetical protein
VSDSVFAPGEEEEEGRASVRGARSRDRARRGSRGVSRWRSRRERRRPRLGVKIAARREEMARIAARPWGVVAVGTLRPEAVGVRWVRRRVVGGSAEMARREGVTIWRWVGGGGCPAGVFEVDIMAALVQLVPVIGLVLHCLRLGCVLPCGRSDVGLVRNVEDASDAFGG